MSYMATMMSQGFSRLTDFIQSRKNKDSQINALYKDHFKNDTCQCDCFSLETFMDLDVLHFLLEILNLYMYMGCIVASFNIFRNNVPVRYLFIQSCKFLMSVAFWPCIVLLGAVMPIVHKVNPPKAEDACPQIEAPARAIPARVLEQRSRTRIPESFEAYRSVNETGMTSLNSTNSTVSESDASSLVYNLPAHRPRSAYFQQPLDSGFESFPTSTPRIRLNSAGRQRV